MEFLKIIMEKTEFGKKNGIWGKIKLIFRALQGLLLDSPVPLSFFMRELAQIQTC